MEILFELIYSSKYKKWIFITQILAGTLISQWFFDYQLVTRDTIWIYYAITGIIFFEEIVEVLCRRMPKFEFEFADRIQEVEADDIIDWINTQELVEFLLKNDWLPTEKYRDTFQVSNVHLKKMWDNLERVGILKRGANNARVVAISDIEIIQDLLKGVVDSSDIAPPLLKVSSWVYEIWLHDENLWG